MVLVVAGTKWGGCKMYGRCILQSRGPDAEVLAELIRDTASAPGQQGRTGHVNHMRPHDVQQGSLVTSAVHQAKAQLAYLARQWF